MADPVTLAMVGAAAGAALKPKDPLKGAMLGAAAGFTGGTALGVGGASAASGGGLAMGSGGVTGLTSGTGAGLSAAGGSTIGLGTGTTAGLSAVPASASLTSAVPGASYSLAAAPTMGNYSLVAPSAVTSAPSASFMDKLGMAGNSAYQNPMMTAQALNATQGLLTPEQQPQIQSAPAMPVQAGRGVKPNDPMAMMDPYQQSVIGGQQISLI